MNTASDLFPCPVCGEVIVARIEVDVKLVAKPREGNTIPVEAETKMLRFNVTHSCRGRTEAAECLPGDAEGGL